MESERKINCEGVPLNSAGAANIFLNTGKNTKVNSPDGTVIHLKTGKPSDLGVHINTTFSIASSKKIKLLFVLNFLLSVICMVVCGSIAFHYWNEMISMRRQLDLIKEHFLIQNLPSLGQEKIVQSALLGRPRPVAEAREGRMENSPEDRAGQTPKKYYVEDLGEDMLLVDAKKKNLSKDNLPTISILPRDLVVAQFNGAIDEHHMGTEQIIGPWVRDAEVSSKDSADKIELKGSYFTMKESGLYLVVYLTRQPNCFFLWASQPSQEPRLLATCATGDDSSKRPLEKSQISCATQTVARLHKGDIVNMAQREPNRTLWLRPGYSYFGFVKLST
ncbi:Uncharacterized protein OBRU01_13650 [Operophtera brumata]|uniref:TNF family profile domain-containing protein n=1 Tax=Operophtera brumata TaxID=104452 RepID=A0A0L7L1G3_OPEBR|nr:Uncharacterized protein OBRU01_13650 [Operophtera brumata]